MIRLGLCCIFQEVPIKFRTTTVTANKRLSRDEGQKKLADLCAANAAALMEALQFCSAIDWREVAAEDQCADSICHSLKVLHSFSGIWHHQNRLERRQFQLTNHLH
jgi:hypothetical protein